jgi:hypothetical protein
VVNQHPGDLGLFVLKPAPGQQRFELLRCHFLAGEADTNDLMKGHDETVHGGNFNCIHM